MKNLLYQATAKMANQAGRNQELLINAVPQMLAGKGWTSDTAVQHLQKVLQATEQEATILLREALLRFPELGKSVEVIYRTLP
jgi:hypothetical protein